MIDFETDVLLLGYLAAYRARFDPTAPVRHWGSELPQDTLRLGNNRYRFGVHRLKENGQTIPGVVVHVDLDHFNGGTSARQIFIPWTELTRVQVSVRGKVTLP